MRKYFGALIFLTATSVLAYIQDTKDAQLETHETEIGVEFVAGFLHPGKNPAQEKAPAMTLGTVEWTSGSTGVVPARMWEVNSKIEFKTSADRKRIELILVNPFDKGGTPQMWDVWRHRHGYVHLPGQGYKWNSLEDVRDPMAEEDGAFYDDFLRSVWSYWTMKRLPQHLKTGTAPMTPQITTDDRFQKNLRVIYDGYGLKKPVSCSLRIHVWDLPVLIAFEVNPSSPSHPSNKISYKVRWTYDLDDIRIRHGYNKDFWGYHWLQGFPSESNLSSEQGKRLDKLLDHDVSYWVDVACQQLLADFQFKIFQRMESS